jgi:hypothetical protein
MSTEQTWYLAVFSILDSVNLEFIHCSYILYVVVYMSVIHTFISFFHPSNLRNESEVEYRG